MNEKEEFKSILSEQNRLQHSLDALGQRISAIEQRFQETERTSTAAFRENPQIGQPTILAGPLPPPLPPQPPAIGRQPASPVSSPPANRTIEEPKPSKRSPQQPFELHVGTYWLVRIGIVLLLTGLVFLGNYFYQNVIAHLGPVGKISFLYFGGGLLTGIGLWLERGKEQLRGYARVVLAGGLASIYYVTYTAHHVPWLRVIPDPFLATALLIFCAAVMTWVSERKRSESMAILSILLAYYASSIGAVLWFTIVSNILLGLAALYLLARRRWLILSFTSLVATYGSFAYWHFLKVGSQAEPAALSMVAIYWILFTAFVLFGGWELSHEKQRYGFACLNNTLFFGLAVHLSWVHPDFWRLPACFGAALLAASAILKFRSGSGFRSVKHPQSGTLNQAAEALEFSNRRLGGMYFGQGVALLTLAVLTYFSGAQLAVVTAVESAFLLRSGRTRSVLWSIGAILISLVSFIAAGLAVADGLFFLGKLPYPSTVAVSILTGFAVGVTFFWNGWSCERARPKKLMEPLLYGFLGTVMWVFTTLNRIAEPHQVVILLAIALGFALLVFWLPATLFRLLSPIFFLAATLVWLTRQINTGHEAGLFLLVVAMTVLNLLWQRRLPDRLRKARAGELLIAVMFLPILTAWLKPMSAEDWLWIGPALSVGMIGYGALFRNRFSQVTGQSFILVGLASYAIVSIPQTPWQISAAPLAALSIAAIYLEVARKGTIWFQVRYLYDAFMVAVTLVLIWKYVSTPWQVPIMALIGTAIVVIGWYTNSRRFALDGSAVQACAILVSYRFIAMPFPGSDNGDLILPLLLAGQHLLLVRHPRGEMPERTWLTGGFAVGAVVTAMGYLTHRLGQTPGGFYLTAGWSLLACAIFILGMLLRERIYRFSGLGLITLALVKIVILDVWGLALIHRIISFMVLGAVLLVIGFLYTRYQDKIRDWL
jgi:Predicted membrane protein (DUF2339)